jgi:hypothetical protein
VGELEQIREIGYAAGELLNIRHTGQALVARNLGVQPAREGIDIEGVFHSHFAGIGARRLGRGCHVSFLTIDRGSVFIAIASGTHGQRGT